MVGGPPSPHSGVAEIAWENVSYQYPNGVRALNQIDLSIAKGTFVVVMGSNGAGKSTLCLTLNGIVPHSTGGTLYGAVRISGVDTMDQPVHELARRVGLVMQNPEAQLLCSSVEDELAFGPENLCVAVQEIRARIEQTAAAVRISDLLDRGPTGLSGGQIQRVVTAAMLTMTPAVMAFDEATSALDPRGATSLFELSRELNTTHGMTVVMTEHKSEGIAELADLVVVLDKGRVVEIGRPRDVFSRVDALAAVNVAPPQVTRVLHALGFPADRLPITLDGAEATIRERLAASPTRTPQGRAAAAATSDTPQSTGAALIEADAVSFDYPAGIHALRDVTLSIRKGEFVGIIGENGAGKTTLVKLLVALMKPCGGTLRLFGRPSTGLTTAALAGRIGLVLQNPDHQLFKGSVLEEVKVGPARLGLAPIEIEDRAREAIETVGLLDVLDRHPLSLSWGDRQRVALASILSMRPEVIIFDEPTTGQDLAGRTIFMELAKSLNAHGSTVVVITHDMELITRYARRSIVMGSGRVLMDASTREVFRHPEVLRKTFLEPPQVIELARRLADHGIPGDVLTVEELVAALASREVRP